MMTRRSFVSRAACSSLLALMPGCASTPAAPALQPRSTKRSHADAKPAKEAPWSDVALAELRRRQQLAYENVGRLLRLPGDARRIRKQYDPGVIPIDMLQLDRLHAQLTKIAGRPVAQSPEVGRYLSRYRNPRLPTDLESPGMYGVLLKMSDDIRNVFERESAFFHGWQPPGVLLGTLPDGQINAKTTFLDQTDEVLITFNLGFMQFLHHISKFVAAASPSVACTRDGLRVTGRFERVDDPSKLETLHNLLRQFVIVGIPKFPATFELADDRIMVASALLGSAESFAVGHEYGHVYVREAHRPATELETARQQELSADEVGFSLAVQASGRADIVTSWSGITTYFSAMQLLDACLSTLSGGSGQATAAGTHPPGDVRMDALKSRLAETQDAETLGRAMEVHQHVVGAFVGAWSQLLPRWKGMYFSGERAAPVWG